MTRQRRRWASLFILLAIVADMVFPGTVFPHPGTNDAIGLADAEWPLLLLEIVGVVVAYVVFGGERGTMIRVSLGVLLFGAAVVLVAGLLVFGNLSDDRFAPLLFFAPVFAFGGFAGIVVAIAAGVRHRAALARGAGYGLALTLFFGAWTFTRGARAWLQAPYGFDLLLLIGLLGAGLVVLGTSRNVRTAPPPA